MSDSNKEIYERLGTIEQTVARIEQWTKDRPCLAHGALLHGNGRPGLVERVGTLETIVRDLAESQRRMGRWIAGAVTTAALAGIGWGAVEFLRLWGAHN